MSKSDAFIERRTASLVDRYAAPLDEIQSQWPQGTVVFADPLHQVLWVMPTTPLDESFETYTTLLEKVASNNTWACIAPDRHILENALADYQLTNATLHVNKDLVTWLVHTT